MRDGYPSSCKKMPESLLPRQERQRLKLFRQDFFAFFIPCSLFDCLLRRLPGYIVARSMFAVSSRARISRRKIGFVRRRKIRLMRLLPRLMLFTIRLRQAIRLMMQPAVPSGRDQRGLCIFLVNHPAPLARIAAARLAGVIDIAVLVDADLMSAQSGFEQDLYI